MRKLLHLAFIIFSFSVCATSFGSGKAQSVKSEQGDLNVVWGHSTNSLRAGLECEQGIIRIGLRDRKQITPAALTVANVSSNIVRFYWPRQKDNRYAVSLKDGSGNPVPRTVKGDAYANISDPDKALTAKDWQRSDFTVVPMWPFVEYPWERFNVGEYFKLDNIGTYTLAISVRVYTREANGTLTSVVLPAVSLPVHVEE